jgi:hypothetical protein
MSSNMNWTLFPKTGEADSFEEGKDFRRPFVSIFTPSTENKEMKSI